MEMLYEYKDVFSLRDEIGTCPNIEVNIEVMDYSPFFIWPYHVKEEDRAVLDKEMSAMACFHLLHNGYDVEVTILVYVTEPTLFYLFHY